MEESRAWQRRKVVPTLTKLPEELPVFDDQALDDVERAARDEQAVDEQAPNEGALVRAALGGDSVAFMQLLRRHDDKMRGVVWRVVRSRSAMDDVLQEAYLKAWRSLSDWRGDAAFSTWLYTIVYRCAIDWVRRERRLAASVVDQGARSARATPDHAQAVVDGDALRRALASLSPAHLAVVTLIDGEGRGYGDVATMLDISEGTVASRLHRARAELRTALGGKR